MMNLGTMEKGFVTDAASKLIQNWEHDEGSLKFWRASSNFVCVFKYNQQTLFLRFNSEKERTIGDIATELEFLHFLKVHGYPCVTPVLSITGKLIVSEDTPEGTFHGVVFQSAKGNMVDDTLTDVQCEAWGKSMATLHELSKAYQPDSGKRKSWKDVLTQIEAVLERHPGEQEAAKELHVLTKLLEDLPISNDVFGLIHYDFQLDNIFYDEESGLFNVIDFDDSMYGWFALDVVSALDDFLEDVDPLSNRKVQAFLSGYLSVLPLDTEMLEQYPTFQRFKNLYTFVRLLRSLEGIEVEEAPDWLENLRGKLMGVRDRLRQKFLNEVRG